MNHHKRIAVKILILVLLCMKCNIRSASGRGEIGEVRCTEREREALLRFKKDLTDEYGVLSSGGSEDDKKECCKWQGVQCSNITGHVIGLLLDGFPNFKLRGNINSALLELHHLNNLDLSYNDFGGDRIPEFIGSIKSLQLLNLQGSNFSGIAPLQLGNLTNLRNLDLSFNSVRSENLNWLSGLSLLTRLDFSGTNLNGPDWLQQIVKLRSLQELHWRFSNITDVILSTCHCLFVNSSSASLSILDLSHNELTKFTFDWIFNISMSLVKLDLSYNKLDGQIPDEFRRLVFLGHLDLSTNMLEGEIPKALGSLSRLRILSVSSNYLGGQIEESFGNISTKGMVSLESMDLSYNQLIGPVPDLMGFSALRELYLRNNRFKSSVPESLGKLSKLEVLDVSFNSLEGTISEANFMELQNLKTLDLSFNSLTVNISSDWNPPFQLYAINLANCKMGPHFPKWIHTQRNFSWLDLSCTGISDGFPTWLFTSLPPELRYLNISHNQISGTIPDFSSTFIDIIDISSNKISGPIPLFHFGTRVFQLSQNMFSGLISSICTIPHGMLQLLDLSNNQLGGALPDCWEQMPYLFHLNLANNSFSGEIPHALGFLGYLRALHLPDNNLSGELPFTLKNCHNVEMIDVGGNKLTGNIPAWIGANYANITYLGLHRNRFYGSIPLEICNLTQIQILDLSENNLSGEIPQCFSNFTSLIEKSATVPIIGIRFGATYYKQVSSAEYTKDYIDYALVQWKGRESDYRKTLGLLKLIDLSSNKLVGSIPKSFSYMRELISLNLSRNRLIGNIIPDIGQMEMLECLDLSRNHLSGEIPDGLAQLHYLAVLDLANNNFSGKIPSSTQLQSFNASVYAGNSELCGPPLSLCPGDGNIPSNTNEGENTEEKDGGFLSLSFMEEFFISMTFGFIIGFWGVVGSLLLKRSWRRAYFNCLDAIGDWLYVTAMVFLTK